MLTSRGLAAELRAEIEAEIAAGREVAVDLEGVDLVSPSFADELFGKLAGHAASGRVTFVNVPPAIEPLIRFVVAGRRGPLPA